MPHDVTMPQLGMAQDAGRIVAWLKGSGDAVAKGDALFEVETDKATMEIEAQAAGFLTDISAAEGEDVAVGDVIARISESADEAPAPPAPDAGPDVGADDDALPEGRPVAMPQLGMAQDTGRIVGWFKALGDAVAADDVLFEVETDKATMEVPAGLDGFLAATLAQEGEDVPVGGVVAIVSDTAPPRTVARAAAGAETPPPRPADPPPAPVPTPAPDKARAHLDRPADGRVLASPKARRLALERGLDLADLAAAGHPQPFHVRDIETLAALPRKAEVTAALPATPPRMLRAEVAADGFEAFAAWAADARGLSDPDALLAGLAGAAMPAPVTVVVERHGASATYAVPKGRALGRVAPADAPPDLVLRDLRGTALRHVSMGAEPVPVLTVMTDGAGLALTLECDAAALDPQAAIALLSQFAGRMEQPLRYLL
jgi:pyruvate dehydrogenase E2 component (dihydrolipoamide acetyltransferase)/2-oxoglutarate dehydrogenase E2 component (dihydrolipoamide succinyltransferase)